jgi:uncharacterized Zn finger protein (UPF0148 family)
MKIIKITAHCKLCKKPLREWNKSGICSNCGQKPYTQLIREGLIK